MEKFICSVCGRSDSSEEFSYSDDMCDMCYAKQGEPIRCSVCGEYKHEGEFITKYRGNEEANWALSKHEADIGQFHKRNGTSELMPDDISYGDLLESLDEDRIRQREVFVCHDCL